MDPTSRAEPRASRPLWIGLLVAYLLCCAATALADPPDAGPPPPGSSDAGSRPGQTPDAAGVTREAGSAPALTRTSQTQAARLREQAEALASAAYDNPTPPAELRRLFKVELKDPGAVAARLKGLTGDQRHLDAQLLRLDGRLSLMKRAVASAEAELAQLKKRQRRRRRIKIPPELVALADDGRKQVAEMSQEREALAARSALLGAKIGFLKRTQPARRRLKKEQQAALDLKLAQQQKAAETERLEAEADLAAAETARKEALKKQKQARSEAERLLARERASLEKVRGDQAKSRKALASRRAGLAAEQQSFEKFRADVSKGAEKLRSGWPATAQQYDLLHDRIVSKLRGLRPSAVEELTARLAGRIKVSAPPARLDSAVRKLDEVYQPRVASLEQLRAELERTAREVDAEESVLATRRLAFLDREISWLNDRRIALIPRLTERKRQDLTWLTRETFSQLSHEVAQLTFDGAYWAYQRLNQLLNWRQLIRDIVAISDLLWRLVQIIVLLLLLRLLLRRWDGWFTDAIHRASRTAGIGAGALRLTKLLDIMRHCGPALLTLGAVSLVYQVVGGDKALAELRVIYIVVFWVALYRVQLRLVESAARYTGMEDALRAAEGGELLEDEPGLEGPPVPMAVRLAHEAAEAGTITGRYLVPASVLLVRSVRAATRYILAVVLILELTALAVGEGTIYGLTARFSWLAALPFVLYFLQLWRPHIARAYLLYARGGEEGALERMVKRSQRNFHGVFIIGAAFLVLLGHRLATFARRYLSSRDATKKLLSFFFRRQVERHAQQTGKVVTRRADLPGAILREFPEGPLGPDAMRMPVPELEELVELYRAWQQDHADGSTALVGHTGMGKSTLLAQLEAHLGEPVLRHAVPTKLARPARVVSFLSELFGFSPKPSSEKELIRMIRKDPHKVVALDNCHNFFLRQVGGFEGWDSFLRVVNETCDQTFWYLAFNEPAWDFLENLSGRLLTFRRVVRMRPWSERQIRRLIMRRMHRALYRTSFSDLVVAQVKEVDFTNELGRTSKGYFRVLWDYTGGNPLLACHFWLDSLVPHREHRLVQVHLFREPDIGRLEALDDDILFTLTAITEHETLTPAQVSRVTNLPTDLCRFACRYCLEGGLLARHQESGRLRLSHRWQQTVIRYLKRKYLLH